MAAERGWDTPWRLDTVYCGGGTPSLLAPEAMARLRDRLHRLVYWEAGAEWTCEANPESFTSELAGQWQAAGVNRLSLGAQTFSEPALRWMGRLHGPSGPGEAVAAARTAGIANISLDLIFGLPQRLQRDWAADLERVAALRPEHVSLYGLTAESATPLGRWVREGRETMAGEGDYAAEYLAAVASLQGHGYAAYEVSNFSLPGRESRHNQAYWDHRAYLGLGPGAHSFLPPERWWNVRTWREYLTRSRAGGATVEGEERVAGEARDLERVWLGLRQRKGLAAAEFSEAQAKLAEAWCERGWAAQESGRVSLTPEGWLRLDSLAVALAAAGS